MLRITGSYRSCPGRLRLIADGIKTNVSVKESYSANGNWLFTGSASANYTVPAGVPITVGGYLNSGNLFDGQANGFYGGRATYTRGNWCLNAFFCRSFGGGNVVGGGVTWSPLGKNNLSFYAGAADNSSSKTINGMPPGKVFTLGGFLKF